MLLCLPFDDCLGTGGNDGVFSGNSQVASADFLPDNGGWQALYAGGAARCVKLGNATHEGVATTPQLQLDGQELELTFYAAPWGNDDTALTLSASGNATLAQTDFSMVKGKWTAFTTKLNGTGATRITFTPGKRFFLDEVVVRHRMWLRASARRARLPAGWWQWLSILLTDAGRQGLQKGSTWCVCLTEACVR